MGVSEEAFVRFVIVTDLLRYHFDSVREFSNKYRHLLHGEDDYKNVTNLLSQYEGKKATLRPIKGFRDTDILFFQHLKSRVESERHEHKIHSTDEDLEVVCPHQFIFDFPIASAKVKQELENSTLYRIKPKSKFLLEGGRLTDRESIAMPLSDNDGNYQFPATTAKTFHA